MGEDDLKQRLESSLQREIATHDLLAAERAKVKRLRTDMHRIATAGADEYACRVAMQALKDTADA